MLDPYLVLGVGKYDDDQVVKKAYRQLSKQYHPDNNINNPNKDAAEETYKKIQQAYEQIMHERSIGIGGPDDLRRKQNSSSGTQNSDYYGSRDRTASKDRYTNGFWNNNSSYNNNTNFNSGSNYNTGNYYNTGNNNNSGSSNSYNNSNNSYNNNYSDSGNNNYSSNNSNYYSSSNNTNYYSSSNNTNYYGGSDRSGSDGNSGYYSGNGNYEYGQGSAGSNGNYGGYYTGQNNYYNEDAEGMLGTVANKLNNRNFFEAWDILNSMNTRNDVWYYYSAIANLGLGNSITALNHARTAKAMQPGRPEYDELINGIQSGAIQYRGRSDMFVPQKANTGNTCLKIGIAMVFMNIFCGGGGAFFSICVGC